MRGGRNYDSSVYKGQLCTDRQIDKDLHSIDPEVWQNASKIWIIHKHTNYATYVVLVQYKILKIYTVVQIILKDKKLISRIK